MKDYFHTSQLRVIALFSVVFAELLSGAGAPARGSYGWHHH